MKGTGPFLNRRYYGEDRPRALFSGMPVGLDCLADFQYFFTDFISEVPELDEVKDAGAAIAVVADAENGLLRITSTATTDNDGGLVQLDETSFLCVAGRELMFEARVRVSDADQGEMFIGLADTAATDPEAVIAAGLARVGFELADGSAVVNCVVDNDTATTSESSGVSMADSTFIRLGFRIDEASIRYYINRALVKTIALPTAIAAVTLGPAFFHLSGDANGTHTADCDYILVVSERS